MATKNTTKAESKKATPKAKETKAKATPKAKETKAVAAPETVAETVPTMAAPETVATVPTVKATKPSLSEAVINASVPEAAPKAAPEAVPNFVGDKFKLTNSAKVGTALDQADKSLWGFCRKICNEYKVSGVDSYFFTEAFIAYIGDAYGYNVATKEGRKGAENVAKAFTDNMKENTWLARSMKNENKMKATFKAELPRFYSAEGVVMAKIKTVAVSVSGVKPEELPMWEAKCKGDDATHKKALIDGLWYFVAAKADTEAMAKDLYTNILQVIKPMAKPEEITKVWIGKNGNLCTLVRKDTFTYKDMLPIITKVMYAKAAKYNYVACNFDSSKDEKLSETVATPEAVAAPETVAETVPTMAAPEAVAAPETVAETVPTMKATKPSLFARIFSKVG